MAVRWGAPQARTGIAEPRRSCKATVATAAPAIYSGPSLRLSLSPGWLANCCVQTNALIERDLPPDQEQVSDQRVFRYLTIAADKPTSRY